MANTESCYTEGERVRMNLSENAKGLYQIEVTVESNSVERSQEMLLQAVRAAKQTLIECGLKEACS